MRKFPNQNSDQSRRALGAYGEKLAGRWYERRGYAIVAANWRCADGEIDLILAKGNTLVFCEVKTRSGVGFGHPAEAVTPAKQARIHRLAAIYLAQREGPWMSDIRFDVAAVQGQQVEIIEHAF